MTLLFRPRQLTSIDNKNVWRHADSNSFVRSIFSDLEDSYGEAQGGSVIYISASKLVRYKRCFYVIVKRTTERSIRYRENHLCLKVW
ncbi:unnamed protein product [Linum trigynum]|uniref:Uncharacterized protein n=1 Tax=Linum trigynum TaxID=586398 RepID=A0AAV2GWG9_9ROSI